MWTKIDDSMINHRWECPDCDAIADVAPWWYSENGTPMCIECDNDMEYCYTEIKNE